MAAKSSSKADARRYSLLARCLSGPVLRQLSQHGTSPYLAAAFQETGLQQELGDNATILEATKSIFAGMRRHYRSDYVYRVAIANKLFLGRHSPATTTFLSELRVGESRADIAMLNGTSTVYEIKTELDNLDRLGSQLDDYSRMFDRTYVVTHDDEVESLLSMVNSSVGIIVLTREFTLRTVREAESNAMFVDIPTIIGALRSAEVAEITKALTGAVPKVGNVNLVAACTKLLLKFSPERVHDRMLATLKKRRKFEAYDFVGVPPELVPAYLDTGLRPRHWMPLTEILTRQTIKDVVDGKNGHLLSVSEGQGK